MEYKIKQCQFSKKLSQEIYAELDEYGIEEMGASGHKGKVAFKIQNDKTLIGCIVAEVWWGSVYINLLFVAKQFRKQGVGTRLLKHALQYASDNSCLFISVTTFNFQAIEFYKKFGFEVEFIRKGYTHDVSLYILRKDLCKNYPF